MSRNARVGLFLFSVYLLCYGGFVGVNAFRPQVMDKTPLEGLNVAVLYGFGLIFLAFVLALLYGLICNSQGDRRPEERS